MKEELKIIENIETVEQLNKQTVSMPEITINSPENNFITYKKNITITGIVKNVKEFFINSRIVKFNEAGKFSEVFDLNTIGKYIFNLTAVGGNNLYISQILKVFRAGKSEEETQKEDSAQLDAVLGKKISLELEGAEIKDVLKILSQKSGMNIISDVSLGGSVDIILREVTLKKAIEYILNTQGLSYKILDKNTLLVADAAKLKTPTQLMTSVIRLNNVEVKDAVDLLRDYLTGEEVIKPLEPDNLLLIHADPRKTEQLLAIVKRIDQTTVPQIFLVAQIIEVSTSALKAMGVAWPQNASLGSDPGTFAEFELSFAISPMVLRLMEQHGQAKILAKPQIKVLNNEEAQIYIGDRLPYVEAISDQAGRLTESIQYADTGITLIVKPSINPDKREIRMKVQPEITYVAGYRGTNNDVPVLRTRKVDTTVWVKDGETIAIGGLFNSSDTSDVVKVPLLGDIPILGNLFSSKKYEDGESELMITVTPRIVTPRTPEN
ncbi:secretin N-terminal domain-containing protein [Thermoproteota archaeon]